MSVLISNSHIWFCFGDINVRLYSNLQGNEHRRIHMIVCAYKSTTYRSDYMKRHELRMINALG